MNNLSKLIRECITEVAVEEYNKKKLTETAKIKRSILPLIKEVLSEMNEPPIFNDQFDP